MLLSWQLKLFHFSHTFKHQVRPLLQEHCPPTSTFTIDLNNILPQDVPWIIFGYFSYQLLDDQVTILVEQGKLNPSEVTDYLKAAAVQQNVNDIR